MALSSLVAVFGLSLDIIGAYFLARGIGGKPPVAIASESATAWGYNGKIMRSLLDQKADSQAGFVFLFAGFLIQLISYLPFARKHVLGLPGLESWIALAILIAISASVAEQVSRLMRSRCGRHQVEHFLRQERNWNDESTLESCARTVEQLLVRKPRQPHEAAADYIRRMSIELGVALRTL
jgi:hypothetical protein